MNQKVGRNDPCPCGSGKKFKKCCEQVLIGKKFRAQKIDNSLSDKATKVTQSLSSLFQKPKKIEEKKPFEETPPTEDAPPKA